MFSGLRNSRIKYDDLARMRIILHHHVAVSCVVGMHWETTDSSFLLKLHTDLHHNFVEVEKIAMITCRFTEETSLFLLVMNVIFFLIDE